jgi:FAD:protein FMN transferase
MDAEAMSHRFAHQAMATEFEIFCEHAEHDYAQQAAWAAFDLLDRLEGDLSRFIENSDISRINSISRGESLRVSRWTMDCLQIARQAFDETNGAFDISLGTGFASLELVAAESTVRARVDGPRLDLGGIGKGYAVDRMVDVLREWEIEAALVHGGHSSVRAMDGDWPVTIDGQLVRLTRQVLSASGIQKKDHIVDPRSGEPVRDRTPVWVQMPAQGEFPCAVAETWSTALMVRGATFKVPGFLLIKEQQNV